MPQQASSMPLRRREMCCATLVTSMCASSMLTGFVVAYLTLASIAHADEAADAAQRAFFEQKVLPVLERSCYGCHSAEADEIKGGLRLDTRDGARTGGDSGPAVVPNDVDASLLVSAIRHEGFEMPPDGPPLAEDEIASIVRWIDMGAPDPREASAVADAAGDLAEARRFWSFQPVRRVEPPPVQHNAWPRNWVDRFVLAKLEAERLTPAPPATKEQLVRRVYFDVTGLAPTPDEIAAFVADESDDAYERLVDRLLASDHYGERQAQHWLDVVRYAETEGFEYDRHITDAWRYRDYVIQSLNDDKPFDRFLTEQIAGDELATEEEARNLAFVTSDAHRRLGQSEAPPQQSRVLASEALDPSNPKSKIQNPKSPQADLLSAAVFHRLGPVRRNAGNQDVAVSRNEVLTERTDALGAAFIGLTVGCARCHNHKLDPIPQKDYYRLQAFLAATEEHDVPIAPAAELAAWQSQAGPINEQIAELNRRIEIEIDRRQELKAEIKRLQLQLPPPLPTIPTIRNDHEHRTPIHVLRRGVWENKGEPVGPRGLSVLVPDDAPELPADVHNPRTQLARWLTDPNHPLVARVYVNRLWQSHFGRGIVATPNDFGNHGDRPSHRELLDAFAGELVAGGWRSKAIHRLILTSSVYRQASQSPIETQAAEKDPGNRWLWKFPRRRLSAEEIRDAMLSAAGKLNPKMFGASVMAPVDQQMIDLLYAPEQWVVTPDATEHARRSIYLIAKRNLRLPFMEAFDQPTAQTSCAARVSTTHAPQSLELLNGQFSNDLAAAFANRLVSECGNDARSIVRRAYRLATGRDPSAKELAIAVEFLSQGATENGSLEEFALAMFNLNGFLYVD